MALLRRRPLSPSAIDTLIQCPFQFYVRMLLSLEDQIPARGLSFDVALKGTIAHRVLEVMLDRHPDPSLKGSDVGRILEKVLDEDFPALEASALRFELDTLRRDLERFVEGYAQLTRELGVMGGRSEWAFGYDQPVLFNFDPDPAFDSLRDTFGKGFRVRGKVDRVLLRDGRPVVIDFKSGDVRKYSAQRSAGMGAQVGLYAWAVSRTKLGAPEAFAYLSVRNNEANAVVIDNANPHTIRLLSAQPNAETLDGVIRALRRALSNQIAALASGSVEPVDELRAAEFAEAKAHPCTYCANDLLCRQKKG